MAALIMFQTLYFKFSAHPESVHLFSEIGIEPWGRIGTGVLELIACFFILSEKLEWLGAIMGVGLMAGAVLSHLFFLGIEVNNDGGNLFIMAVLVLIASFIILLKNKNTVLGKLKMR